MYAMNDDSKKFTNAIKNTACLYIVTKQGGTFEKLLCCERKR